MARDEAQDGDVMRGGAVAGLLEGDAEVAVGAGEDLHPRVLDHGLIEAELGHVGGRRRGSH
eukprot:983457-Heterocapsa_arctica.AAC.1